MPSFQHFGHISLAIYDNLTSSYATYEELLSAIPGLESPAWIHGWATGLFAAGYRPEPDYWLEQLSAYSGTEAPNLGQFKPFLNLIEASLDGLQSCDFAFQLFLPEEDADFSQRLESFAQWCQGFLHGFGALQQELSAESIELLKDLDQISQIDCNTVEDDENEGHFIELEEFVRVAAMNLFLEYTPEKEKDSNEEEKYVH